MWPDLPKPATQTHTMAKNAFHHQLISPSINELITITSMPKVNCSAFTEIFSKAYQMSMSAQVPTECHWLACTCSHLAGNYHPTHWWYSPWFYLYFVTFRVQCGLKLGLLISSWRLLSFAVTCHLMAPHPYTSARGVDENYLKFS